MNPKTRTLDARARTGRAAARESNGSRDRQRERAESESFSAGGTSVSCVVGAGESYIFHVVCYMCEAALFSGVRSIRKKIFNFLADYMVFGQLWILVLEWMGKTTSFGILNSRQCDGCVTVIYTKLRDWSLQVVVVINIYLFIYSKIQFRDQIFEEKL